MKLTEYDILRHAPEYGEASEQVPCEKCVESEESHRNDTMDYDTLFSAYELRSEQNTSALPATTKMAPFSPSVLVMFLLMLFVGGMGTCGIICASLSLMTPVEGLLLVSFMFLLTYAFTEGVRRSFGTVRQKRTMYYIRQAFLILSIASLVTALLVWHDALLIASMS